MPFAVRWIECLEGGGRAALSLGAATASLEGAGRGRFDRCLSVRQAAPRLPQSSESSNRRPLIADLRPTRRRSVPKWAITARLSSPTTRAAEQNVSSAPDKGTNAEGARSIAARRRCYSCRRRRDEDEQSNVRLSSIKRGRRGGKNIGSHVLHAPHLLRLQQTSAPMRDPAEGRQRA